MKKFIFLLLLFGLLLIFLPMMVFGQGMIRTVKAWTYGQYIEYRPATPGDYPVILFLHGIGERGSDINLVERNEIPKLLKNGLYIPYVVICPQLPANQSGWYKGTYSALKPILDEFSERHITGLSLGGMGTYNFVTYDTAYFSTAGVVCGKTTASPQLFKTIPIKIWHDTGDTVVPPDQDYKLTAHLEAIKARVGHKYSTGLGHSIWDEVYNPSNPEGYWQWLESIRNPDSQKKNAEIMRIANEVKALMDSLIQN